VKLTVGIPTFNRATLLSQAIESVLAQTFTSFRLIVSDNASDENIRDVVRSFDDERIDYVRSERNIGPIGNINRLIGLADTEFLMLLPDDDVLYPEHLEAAVDVLERFKTAGLAHTAFDLIDGQSRVIGSEHPLAPRSPVMIERGDSALERMMVVTSWAVAFSTVVYRTKAIVAAGGLRVEEGPLCDFQLWMRMAIDWDFGYVAKPLVGLRMHPEMISSSIGDQDQIRFNRRMAFLEEAPLDPRKQRWLLALATLQFLAERAAVLPWSEVAARLANILRTCPRIVLRRAVWRLVLAQLGGRRMRSACRGVSSRQRRLGPA
jgi:glycosyltransferase involved in cell wall biosynthesis